MIHRNKLETMKSTAKSNSSHQMDNNRPKRHKHLEQNAKRRQLEDEHYAKIERENRILIEKMYSIMNAKAKPNAMEFQPGMRLNSNQGPIVDCYLSPRSNFPGHAVPHKSLNQEARRREHEKIMEQNMQILKRLEEKKPVYSTKALLKERKNVEGYLANISNSTTTGYLPSPRSGQAGGSQWGANSSGIASSSAGAARSDASTVLVPAKLAPIRPKGKKKTGRKSAREAKIQKSAETNDNEGRITETDDTEAAALKIQAIARGRDARKSVAQITSTPTSVPIAAKPSDEEDKAASKLQAMQRGKVARTAAKQKKVVEDNAATKLQAMQRGKEARRKKEKVQEDMSARKKKEEDKAATKLQAMQRGKKARKVKTEKQEDKAATKLQAMQRGKRTRKEKQEKEEQNKAATLLQSKQRSHNAAIKVKKLKEEKQQKDAATKIQAINRRKRSTLQVQEMRHQKEAAVKIQAVKRRQTAMHQVEEIRKRANRELLYKSGQKIGEQFCFVEVFREKNEEDNEEKRASLHILVRASSPRNDFKLECKIDDGNILEEVGENYETVSKFLMFDDTNNPTKLVINRFTGKNKITTQHEQSFVDFPTRDSIVDIEDKKEQ